jgi:predicted nucleic-acid-binding protein
LKIAVDTNVLLRAALDDDPIQSKIAQSLLGKATTVTISIATLCEFAWVLSRGARARSDEIELAIRKGVSGRNVVVDRNAVEAGLAMLRHGGDFADGVIAYEGARNGAEFVSFDRRAVKLALLQGLAARVPT